MINNFYGGDFIKNSLSVKNGDTLSLGRHELSFIFAPMVHWPEVMMTYDAKDKVFSPPTRSVSSERSTQTRIGLARQEDTISASSENTAGRFRRCSRRLPLSISP